MGNLNNVQIGRIVHFASEGGGCEPALVVKVHDQQGVNGNCNLAVFDEHGGSIGRTSVVRDETNKSGGTWHWPNECKRTS